MRLLCIIILQKCIIVQIYLFDESIINASLAKFSHASRPSAMELQCVAVSFFDSIYSLSHLQGLKVTMKKHPSALKLTGALAEKLKTVQDTALTLYEGNFNNYNNIRLVTKWCICIQLSHQPLPNFLVFLTFLHVILKSWGTLHPGFNDEYISVCKMPILNLL